MKHLNILQIWEYHNDQNIKLVHQIKLTDAQYNYHLKIWGIHHEEEALVYMPCIETMINKHTKKTISCYQTSQNIRFYLEKFEEVK